MAHELELDQDELNSAEAEVEIRNRCVSEEDGDFYDQRAEDLERKGKSFLNVRFLPSGPTLGLRQSFLLSDGTGGALWDSSLLLLSYLCRHYCLKTASEHASELCMEDLRIIELGAGIGVASLQAALYGAEVLATDGDLAILDVLKQNCHRHRETLPNPICVLPLTWGDLPAAQTIREEYGPFDLIIGCDLLYDDSHYESLKSTIGALQSDETELILCYRQRYPARERNFIQGVAKDGLLPEELLLSEKSEVHKLAMEVAGHCDGHGLKLFHYHSRSTTSV